MKKFLLLTLAVVLSCAVGYAKGNGTDDNAKTPDGVEAVDLGLSVKWANMNVGAKKASDYGSYFAWGETKTKEFFSWNNYAWTKGNNKFQTKYSSLEKTARMAPANRGEGLFLTKYSSMDKMTRLTPADDAARANWGEGWRTPTAEEFEELLNPAKCSWEWTTKNGVNGYKITGKKTGNSIFMPITGFRFYGDVQFRGIMGVYWTATLYPANPNMAWCLEFNVTDADVVFGNLSSNRFSGRCVRAVK